MLVFELLRIISAFQTFVISANHHEGCAPCACCRHLRHKGNPLRILTVLLASACGASLMPAVNAQAIADAGIAPPPAPIVLEKIVVSGEQPGPGMWKVSKGEHVLWIVGTQLPVPKKMTWRAKGVAAIVAQSKEVLGEPSVSISAKKIGYFTSLWLLPSAMESRKNPDGATLKDIVPPEMYRRWEALRARYVGEYNINDEENDMERWRPMFAALRLYRRAIDASGMSSTSPVWPVIREAANRHGVKITEVKFEPDIVEPGAAIREFRASRLADLECFSKTIERIETDLTAMRSRANAWAVGDVDALRKLPATDQRAVCETAIRNAPFMKTLGAQDLIAQVESMWLNAAESALGKNSVTLAVLPIAQLVSPAGYLAKLRMKGYLISEPDSATE